MDRETDICDSRVAFATENNGCFILVTTALPHTSCIQINTRPKGLLDPKVQDVKNLGFQTGRYDSWDPLYFW